MKLNLTDFCFQYHFIKIMNASLRWSEKSWEKVFFTITISFLIATSAGIPLQVSAAEHDVNIRVGLLTPAVDRSNSPNKISFDGIIGFNIGVVRYFAIGFETGVNWVSWKTYTGSQLVSPVFTTLKTEETNAFTMPFLINAMIRFDMREQWRVMPYLTPGAGYGFTYFKHPDGNAVYHGFTWQIIGGVSVRVTEDRTMEVMVEMGYRGAFYKDSHDYELDMSGLVFHMGLRFPIDGDSR